MLAMEAGAECVICFRPLCGTDVRACKCSSGRYHKECILEWLVRYKSSCPLCLRNGREIGLRARDYKHLNTDKELLGAVKAQRAPFVELLLSLSANPNQLCEGRNSLLEYSLLEAGSCVTPVSAAVAPSLEVSRALLKDPRTKKQRALDFVVGSCWNTQCVDLLVEFGSSVNARDGGGRTALHHAVQRCHSLHPDFHPCETMPCVAVQFVGKLLSLGAAVDARDRQGQTALMLALHHVEVVRLLLKHGADVNAQDANGETALTHATNTEVRRLLTEHGAVSKGRSKTRSKLRRIGFRVKRSALGLDRFQLPKLRKRKHSWQVCGGEGEEHR